MAELRKRGPQVGRSDQFRTSKVSVRSNADSYLGSLYASTILSMDNDDDLAQEKVQTLNDQQWVLQVLFTFTLEYVQQIDWSSFVIHLEEY